MKRYVLLAGTAIISVAAGLSVYFFNQQQAQLTTNTLEPFPAAVFNAPQDMIGQQRPDFTLPDLNGQQRHISEWDGLVVALNFWATWCPPEGDPGIYRLADEICRSGPTVYRYCLTAGRGRDRLCANSWHELSSAGG